MYLEYGKFNELIDGFKKQTKKGNLVKLPYYYLFTKNKCVVMLSIIQDSHEKAYFVQAAHKIIL